jgi:hypothetical protein
MMVHKLAPDLIRAEAGSHAARNIYIMIFES